MIRFVNIKTEEITTFESWDEVEDLGGLQRVFINDNYADIYNEDAVNEQTLLLFDNEVEAARRKKAIELFKQNPK